MENKLFGYNENEIKKSFSSRELASTITEKIEPKKTTLETLVEASKKLLQEDKEFLKDIYQ